MALQSYQLSFNGLTFGAGTDVQLVSATGLRDLPPARSQDQPRPRAHGAFGGLTYLGERTITLTLLVAVTVTDWETVLQQVAAAFQPIPDPANLLPLQVQLPGWSFPVQVMCRPTRYAVPTDRAYSHHYATVTVELVAPDPMWYGPTVTATAGIANPTSGATFPWSFPLSFGSSSGGALSVVNTGNAPTSPQFQIQGPCTNPWIESGTNRLTVGISLTSSDLLTVDTAARTITLNSTASRYNDLAVGSRWFTCPPGTTDVSFGSGDSTAVAGTCTAVWASAYASI